MTCSQVITLTHFSCPDLSRFKALRFSAITAMQLATSKSHATVLPSGVVVVLESMLLILVGLTRLSAATVRDLTPLGI